MDCQSSSAYIGLSGGMETAQTSLADLLQSYGLPAVIAVGGIAPATICTSLGRPNDDMHTSGRHLICNVIAEGEAEWVYRRDSRCSLNLLKGDQSFDGWLEFQCVCTACKGG